ncbi:MAG: hypothetical protein AAF467_27345 [Actinomycetota bacterium]
MSDLYGAMRSDFNDDPGWTDDDGRTWHHNRSYEGLAYREPGDYDHNGDHNSQVFHSVGGVEITYGDMWGSGQQTGHPHLRILEAAEAKFNDTGGLVGHWERTRQGDR